MASSPTGARYTVDPLRKFGATKPRVPRASRQIISCCTGMLRMTRHSNKSETQASFIHLPQLAHLVYLQPNVLPSSSDRTSAPRSRLADQFRHRNPDLGLLQDRHDLVHLKSLSSYSKISLPGSSILPQTHSETGSKFRSRSPLWVAMLP